MNLTKTILLCTAISMVASACAKIDVTKEYAEEKPTPIGFDTYAQKTKAYYRGDINNNADFNVAGYQFGVCGYHNSKVYLGSESAGAEQKFDGVSWQYAKTSEIRFWPSSGSVDFFAYFPFNTSATMVTSYATSQPVMTLTNWTDGSDVMYSVALAKTKSETTSLQFKHVFSEIKQINVKIDPTHPIPNISFKVGGITLTSTCCETDAKIKVYKDGTYLIENGPIKKQRRYVLTEITLDKEHPQTLLTPSNCAYIFPVTTDKVWDGSKGTNIAENNVALKISMKVLCGDAYILGTETDYVDVYVPLKSSPSMSLDFERAKRYVFNINFKNGLGYDKDGNERMSEITPIAFAIDNTEAWGDVSVNVTI